MHRMKTIVAVALLALWIRWRHRCGLAENVGFARKEHCAALSCAQIRHLETTPCSHCSCAVHNGSVIAGNNGVHVSADVQPSVFILIRDEPAQVGPPAAIDHPPQLA